MVLLVLKISEANVQRQILDWLKLRRVFHWRNNTGAVKLPGRFLRFGWPGSPDIFALSRGTCYGIEVKALKGKQSLLQHDFQLDFTEAGGIYLLCRSLEDVIGGMR
jgi:hypothetical protein